MDYRLIEIRSMLLLRWEHPVGAAVVRRAIAEIATKAAGGPRGLVIVVADFMSVPDRETRELLVAELGAMRARLQWLGLVVEGTGLVADLKRLFVRALSSLSGQKLPTYSTVAEAAAAAPPALAGDAPSFAAEFQRALARPG